MSELVDSSKVAGIVGTERGLDCHYGRAVSAEQKVYILHSYRCLASGIDLRDCVYSLALDNDIDLYDWKGCLDVPVVLDIQGIRLVPLRRLE